MREVKLTNDQYDMLRKTDNEITIAKRMLGEVIVTAIEQAAEREEDFWESVRELAKAEPGDTYHVDYLGRRIVVKKADES